MPGASLIRMLALPWVAEFRRDAVAQVAGIAPGIF